VTCKHSRPPTRLYLTSSLYTPSVFQGMSSHVRQSHSLFSEACSGPSCGRCEFDFHQPYLSNLDLVQKAESPCSARYESCPDIDRANVSV
jgi:hypothetical protein